MSTIYYKTSQNYFDPRKSENIYVPQPFLNYGGLTKMLNDDYRYNINDSSNIVYSQPRPEQTNNRRAMSARQRFDQNKMIQEERAKKLNQRYVIGKTNPNTEKKPKIVFG